jgi:hypothetical protein
MANLGARDASASRTEAASAAVLTVRWRERTAEFGAKRNRRP